MARLKDLLATARPVLFEADDGDEYSYAGTGTCFLAQYRAELYVITAAHVIDDLPPERLRILPSDHSDSFLAINRHYRLTSVNSESRANADVTLFRVDTQASDVSWPAPAAVVLDGWVPRRLVPGTKFLAPGYPDEMRSIDEEAQKIRYGQVALELVYAGASPLPLHFEVQCSTAPMVQSRSGFSGSPVFAVANSGDQDSCAFAGVLTRERHVLDGKVLLAVLDQIARRAGD